jgi:hypothetical protein
MIDGGLTMVKIGSSKVRFACGTNTNVRVLAGWAIANAVGANGAATAPFTNARRFIVLAS